MIVALELFNAFNGTDQRHATTRHHALLHSCAGCVERVLDAGFLFLHLNFGCRANFDHSNAARKLGNTLLQLLTIVVGGCVLDPLLDLFDTALDVVGFASAIDNGCIFLGDLHLLGGPEIIQARLFEAESQLLGNDRTAGEDTKVL